MGYAESATTWALQIANDNSHGYSQSNRWGPDYDCSSLVTQAYEEAGLKVKEAGASYTGNMKNAFLSCGFTDITSSINLSTGDGLALGDVVLNEESHVEMSLGDGRTVGAHSNYDGVQGDSGGREICPVNYTNHPWNVVLRPPGGGGGVYGTGLSGTNSTSGLTVSTLLPATTYTTYTCKEGDTLSSIANEYRTTVSMLIYLNDGINVTTDLTGKELKIPENKTDAVGTIASTQAITKAHSEGITVSNPYSTVQIYTESGMLSIRQTLTIADNAMDNDILSISTSRDMQSDCPTFTITLSFRREWYEKAGSNDLVIINMVRPPEADKSVFFGLIDDVRKSTSFNSSSPQRTITITGRGFGKAFARFEIGILSELNGLSSVYGCVTPALLESIKGSSPAKVATLLTTEYIGKGCNYTFANDKGYMDYFQATFEDKPNCKDKLTDTSTFLTYEGSLWNMLKEVKNAPFNEMFWEIVDGRPTLIFRYTPFNEEQWTDLLRVTIKDLDILNEDLGVSDTETYTVYKVDTETFSDTLSEAILPIWFPPYYKKYGLSRLSVTSKYLYAGTITATGGASGDAEAITAGQTIEIPDGLGKVHTYMGWQLITSPSSTQYKLREQAGQNFDGEGFGKINGRYVIACTTTFGQVGDYVDFYQEDGTIIKSIIGDIKNPNDAGCNKWGHLDGTCIIEFVVDRDSWYNSNHANPGNPTCHPEWSQYLTKAVNGGSYFDNPSGPAKSTKVEEKAPTTTPTTSSGSFKTYALSDSQLRGLAAVCEGEQGTPKGAAAEASLMANRVELYGGSTYPATPEGLWDYVRNSGWFAHPAGKMDSGDCSSEVLSAVKSVLVDGKRTVPAYVDEHDCFTDITSATNGGSAINIEDRSAYVKCTTKVKNKYGSNYTFYSFPDTNSDPFGYIKESNRTKFGDACYDFEGNLTEGGEAGDATGTGTLDKEAMMNMMIDIYNWNVLNNAMENGSIVVKGSNVYQVGTRVAIESTGKEYYVEGVTHSFTFFQGWTTTLQLTRGIEAQIRFAPPWNSYQQMTQEDASKILGYTIDEAISSAGTKTNN